MYSSAYYTNFKAQKIFLPFMLATAVVVVVFGFFKDGVLLLLRSCCVQDPNPAFNGFFMMTYNQKFVLYWKQNFVRKLRYIVVSSQN